MKEELLAKEPMFKAKITDLTGYTEASLVEHYFGHHTAKIKKNLVEKILKKSIENKVNNIKKYNSILYEIYLDNYETAKKSSNLLLSSILYTALSYEYNEQIKDSLFDGVFMPNVHKFGKPFMNAQKNLYSKNFVQVFDSSEEDLRETQIQIESFISFLVENVRNVTAMCLLGDFAKAFRSEPDTILETIEQINKKNK